MKQEVIKETLKKNIDFLAECLCKNQDIEIKSSKDGVAIYTVTKKRCAVGKE